MTNKTRRFGWVCFLGIIIASLAACGGGGGGAYSSEVKVLPPMVNEDSTAAVQGLLNAGGLVSLTPGMTYLIKSANLTFVSDTLLRIPPNTTLHLAGTRLSGFDVSNITITGGGRILSTKLNTTDPYPPNMYMRGIVEFASTTLTPIENITVEGIELAGDWVGKPWDIAIDDPYDKRRGLVFSNTRNVTVRGNIIHGIIAEAIINNQGGSVAVPSDNTGHLYENNTVYDCNFEAISGQQIVMEDAVYRNNTIWNMYQGIEVLVGLVEGNVVRQTSQAAYGAGYNYNGGHRVTFRNNKAYDSQGWGYFLAFSRDALSGPVVFEGNESHNSGHSGIVFGNINHVTATGNIVTGAGATPVAGWGPWASMELRSVSGGYIGQNTLTGQNFSGVIGLWASGNVTIGENHVTRHAIDYYGQ